MPILTKEDAEKEAIIQAPPGFKNRVTLSVKKQKMRKNKDGYPMLQLTTEIIIPDKVVIDGREYVIAGEDVLYFLIFSNTKTEKMKKTFWQSALGFLERVGLPTEIDTDKPLEIEAMFEKLIFDAVVSTTERAIQVKDPETGKLVNAKGPDGKDITNGWQFSLGNLEDVICRNTSTVASPF